MGDVNKEHLQEVTGSVDRVVYKNDENGFSVFTLKVSAQDTITATGLLPNVLQGEVLTLLGTWQSHKKFGRQFVVQSFQTSLPSSVLGIQKYLSSGMIKGIGPKFAEKIVKRFGKDTLEIIDKEPEKLAEIDGVGAGRVDKIRKAWFEQKEVAKVMVFLREKNVSPGYAVKIFKRYGSFAIDKITANPYCLVDDIWGIGFKSADAIAQNIGIEQDAPERIQAAIIYMINQATSSGHLYVEITQLQTSIITLLALHTSEITQKLIKDVLNNLYYTEKIKIITYLDQQYITTPGLYYTEHGLANKITRFIDYQKLSDRISFDLVYTMVSQSTDIILNEQQQKGIITCLQNNITIITGGPGTGKTTLIKRLLAILDHYKYNVKLAAPTGRAAKRMFEGTGKHTETLHRLLEFSPVLMDFSRNQDNALELDFLILDEASMIDVFLMNAVFKALPRHAHLVLLGDVDQLPSVGAGNVLSDMISSEKVAVVRLTEIFRQAQDSMIILNAHNVNNGIFPVGISQTSKKDFYFIKEDQPELIFPKIAAMYLKKFPSMGISVKNSVILPPMNRGIAGVARINNEIQTMLNPLQENTIEINRFGTIYRVHDRVMQIRNNYDKFVFNGDIGYITAIHKQDQTLTVLYGQRDITYDFAELNELVLAYAISIHKSQGSEFDAVIIPIFMQHFILLQRNLLYTAITRAKKLCILIGQSKAIAMAINNNTGTQRLTFLKQFLTSDLSAQ